LADKQEQLRAKLSKWINEKNLIVKIKENKDLIEKMKVEADDFERKFDYQAVARIRYSDIPAAEKEIESIEKELHENQKR
jgi:ATP-dependent Clp protease ATP-binding subunit ClpB